MLRGDFSCCLNWGRQTGSTANCVEWAFEKHFKRATTLSLSCAQWNIILVSLDSVAVLTKELAQASGETQAESVMHDIASWWLLICGIIYTAAVSHSWWDLDCSLDEADLQVHCVCTIFLFARLLCKDYNVDIPPQMLPWTFIVFENAFVSVLWCLVHRDYCALGG